MCSAAAAAVPARCNYIHRHAARPPANRAPMRACTPTRATRDIDAKSDPAVNALLARSARGEADRGRTMPRRSGARTASEMRVRCRRGRIARARTQSILRGACTAMRASSGSGLLALFGIGHACVPSQPHSHPHAQRTST